MTNENGTNEGIQKLTDIAKKEGLKIEPIIIENGFLKLVHKDEVRYFTLDLEYSTDWAKSIFIEFGFVKTISNHGHIRWHTLDLEYSTDWAKSIFIEYCFARVTHSNEEVCYYTLDLKCFTGWAKSITLEDDLVKLTIARGIFQFYDFSLKKFSITGSFEPSNTKLHNTKLHNIKHQSNQKEVIMTKRVTTRIEILRVVKALPLGFAFTALVFMSIITFNTWNNFMADINPQEGLVLMSILPIILCIFMNYMLISTCFISSMAYYTESFFKIFKVTWWMLYSSLGLMIGSFIGTILTLFIFAVSLSVSLSVLGFTAGMVFGLLLSFWLSWNLESTSTKT